MKLQIALNNTKINREKMDFIIAFGEGLLNLKSDRDDLLQVQIIAEEILKSESERAKTKQQLQERDLNMIGNESSYIMSDLVATDLLMDECGQYALKVLHRYLHKCSKNGKTSAIRNCWISARGVMKLHLFRTSAEQS